MRATKSLLLATVLVSTTGCAVNWSERVTGTVIGAGAGGVAGGLLGGAGGAVLGTVAGGAAGYIVGDWIADQRERCECGPATAAAPPTSYAGLAEPPGATDAFSMGERGSTAPARDARAAARRAYQAGRRAATANDAIAHFDEASRLDPRAPEPHNAKALVLLYGGDRNGARAEFEAAVAADPTYGPAKQNLARLDRAAP